MKEVQDRLPEIDTGGLPVELVTISIDPDQDTPEVLQRLCRGAWRGSGHLAFCHRTRRSPALDHRRRLRFLF